MKLPEADLESLFGHGVVVFAAPFVVVTSYVTRYLAASSARVVDATPISLPRQASSCWAASSPSSSASESPCAPAGGRADQPRALSFPPPSAHRRPPSHASWRPPPLPLRSRRGASASALEAGVPGAPPTSPKP